MEEITNDVLVRIRAKSFLGQAVKVDEVWFKSAGKNSNAPDQSLLGSNFIFVYNLPSYGFSQTELESLTKSNNVVFLPEMDDDTQCAFVELPGSSEGDWRTRLSSVRKYLRRGCQFSIDEVWLNPIEEKKRPSPASPTLSPLHPSEVDGMDPGRIVDTSDLATVKRILTGERLRDTLSRLLDEEIRALGEFVNTNLQLLQDQIRAHQPDALPMFFENIKVIHAEHCSRRNGHLPLTGMGKESFNLALVLATSKIEMASNKGLTLRTRPMQPTSHKRARYIRSRLEDEPSSKRAAFDENLPTGRSVANFETETTSLLFVNRIPKSLTLLQLLSGVPCVDSFVFSESDDPHTKSGFAFLNPNSSSLLSDIVQAFRKNGSGIELFRVQLEPLSEGKATATFQTQKFSSNAKQSPFGVPTPPPEGPLPQDTSAHLIWENDSEYSTETDMDISSASVTPEVSFVNNADCNVTGEQTTSVRNVASRWIPVSGTESQSSEVVTGRVGPMHECCPPTDMSHKNSGSLDNYTTSFVSDHPNPMSTAPEAPSSWTTPGPGPPAPGSNPLFGFVEQQQLEMTVGAGPVAAPSPALHPVLHTPSFNPSFVTTALPPMTGVQVYGGINSPRLVPGPQVALNPMGNDACMAGTKINERNGTQCQGDPTPMMAPFLAPQPCPVPAPSFSSMTVSSMAGLPMNLTTATNGPPPHSTLPFIPMQTSVRYEVNQCVWVQCPPPAIMLAPFQGP